MREQAIKEGTVRVTPRFAIFRTLVEDQWVWWEWYISEETWTYIMESDTYFWKETTRFLNKV